MHKSIVLSLAMLVGLTSIAGAQETGAKLLAQVDHLVYATPDLKVGTDAIEKLLGIRATPGGQHPGMGTRNALVAPCRSFRNRASGAPRRSGGGVIPPPSSS